MNANLTKLFEEVQNEYKNIEFEQMLQGCIQEVVGNNVISIIKDVKEIEEDFLIEMDIDKFPKDPKYPVLTPGVIFYIYFGVEKETQEEGSVIKFSQEVWTPEMLAKLSKIQLP